MRFKKLLDSTFILGLLSLLGYLCAYCFEWGYLTFYEISPSFINVDIPTLALTALVLFIFYSFFHIFDAIISPLIISLRSGGIIAQTVAQAVLFWSLISLFIFYAHWVDGNTIPIKLILIIGIGSFAIYFLIPIIFHPKTKGLAAKLQKSKDAENKPVESISIFSGYDNTKLLMIFSLVMVLAGLSFTGGRYMARHTNIYATVVTDNDSEHVVIKSYGDKLLVAEVVKGNTTGSYQMLQVSDDMKLRNKRIDINR